MALLRRLLMKASMSSAASKAMSSHHHLLGPGGFAKARSDSCSPKKKANDDIFIVENRPYIPTLLFDANDYEASVIHVAKVILSHHAAAADEIIDTSTMMTSTTSDKVTVISGGLTNALYRVDFISDDNENNNDEGEGKSNNMTTTTATTSCTTSVLVRIFGAEGMIDRDLETTNFARLCDATSQEEVVVHSNLNYLGRFGNGRVETWLHDMRQGTLNDLHHNNDDMKDEKKGLVLEVIRQLARLHYGFDIPSYLLDDDDETDTQQQQQQPVLWSVLASWNDELITKISQLCTKDVRLANILYYALFGETNNTASSGGPSQEEDDDDKNEQEESVVTTTEFISHISQQLKKETRWLQDYIVEHHPNAPISFCHNDINAANVLINVCLEDDNNNSDDGGSCHDRNNVAIIDYEYGAINYAMYDVANFICEHCGGNDNGVPNYELLPSMELQKRLIQEYIGERDRIRNTATTTNTSTIVDNDDEEVTALLSQAQTFQMASHLYWGTWGILQGVTELLEEGTYETEDVKSRLHGESDVDRWDNLRYGHNRLARYREHKQSILSK
jgi:thiamine kinase-like enzyme